MPTNGCVLNTRPSGQNFQLSEVLRAHGLSVIEQPLLAISEVLDSDLAREQLRAASQFDAWIFVSTNAVDRAARLLEPPTLLTPLLVAVGEATAALVLERFGRGALTPLDRADSEGVLALAELHNLRDVALIGALGGRDTIAEGLRARGTRVKEISVYRRIAAQWSDVNIHALRANAQTRLLATSAQSVTELALRLREFDLTALFDAPLIVPSERVHAHAGKVGFSQVLSALGASHAQLLAAVLLTFKHDQPR